MNKKLFNNTLKSILEVLEIKSSEIALNPEFRTRNLPPQSHLEKALINLKSVVSSHFSENVLERLFECCKAIYDEIISERERHSQYIIEEDNNYNIYSDYEYDLYNKLDEMFENLTVATRNVDSVVDFAISLIMESFYLSHILRRLGNNTENAKKDNIKYKNILNFNKITATLCGVENELDETC